MVRAVTSSATAVLDPDEFKAIFRRYPAGVSVVTADGPAGPVGLTATSIVSICADPAILMFSLSDSSSSAPAIAAAETVVVHLLDVEQQHIARLCATSGVDRFADTALWSRLETGEPHFHSTAWIRGRIVERMRIGASTVMAVHALDSSLGSANDRAPGSPLVYVERSWHGLGEHSRLAVE